MPKVSICIPAYNNLSGIKRLLESIQIQDFNDYEIIITDDTTDDSISSFIQSLNNNSIIYVKNLKQLGSPENWNAALSLATGAYIKIMHHDDWFTFSDSLTKFIDLLERDKESQFAFSGSRQFELSTSTFFDRSITTKQVSLLKNDIRLLIAGNFIGAPSATIFKRNNLRFDKALKWLVDIDFYINYLKGTTSLLYTKEPLVSIGISDSQVTQTCVNDKQLLCSEYLNEIHKHSLFNNWNIGRHAGLFLLSQEADLDFFLKNGLSLFFYYRTCFERLKQSFNNSLAWFFRKLRRRLEKVFCS